MKIIKGIAGVFKGIGAAIVSLPRDVRRYLAIRRM